MKIHIHQIPAEGLHLEGQEENDILDLRDPNILPLENVHYSLDLGLSGSGLFVTGRLWVRCRAGVRRLVFSIYLSGARR